MKYKTKACDDDMTFQDCELAILRHAVDESEEMSKRELVRNDQIDHIIGILEEFLVRKQLVCYGGTAINNILPTEAQFYNRDVEVPDYDFYSPHALDDAVELADIYYKKGYTEVEAKAGVHYGTFKVFVNFTPIADITYLPETLFKTIQKEAISVAGIKYSPPDFLRMNMYLELSRPKGDVSRWEKVLKRLTILNQYYPFSVGYNCERVNFQRNMDEIPVIDDDMKRAKGGETTLKKSRTMSPSPTSITPTSSSSITTTPYSKSPATTSKSASTIPLRTFSPPEMQTQEKIYETVRDTFIDQGVVFFGGYASGLYSKYMPVKQRRLLQKVPDFDVLSESPTRVALIVQERLADIGIKKDQCHVVKRESVGEIIPVHYEIRIGKDILAHIYEPVACHSYNEIYIDGRKIKVGTIDTLLTFYLAFKYANQAYYYPDRIMCMAKFLFDVQQENRLEQKGMLKRFSIDCVGKQATLDDMRVEKSEKFKELADQRGTREYDMWFLKYNPAKPESKNGKKQGKMCACSKEESDRFPGVSRRETKKTTTNTTPNETPESVKKTIKSPKKTQRRQQTPTKPKSRTNRTKKQAALIKLFGK